MVTYSSLLPKVRVKRSSPPPESEKQWIQWEWLKTKEIVVNIFNPPPLSSHTHIHRLTQKMSANRISKKCILPEASQTFNEWKLINGKRPTPPSLPYCCVWKIKHWKNSCWDITLPLNVFPRVERGGEGRGDVGYLSRSFNNSNIFLDDITRGFKRGRRGGGRFTLFTKTR